MQFHTINQVTEEQIPYVGSHRKEFDPLKILHK